MRFSPVPSESKKQINKAGKILIDDAANLFEILPAYELANKWRACHAYPINTFQSTLRNKLRRNYSDCLVAQRLKRMPTIIEKLKRFPSMQLTTMQDIGGVRAILPTVDDVNRLTKEYLESQFHHELTNTYDYINNPRNEDGYRSVHLVYKYNNIKNPPYDGLRIELQIRTKLQHVWATAVETMGTFLGQALKSRVGDQNWLDYFSLVSSAFAYKENTPLIPKYADLTCEETFAQVAETTKNLSALDIMDGISAVVQDEGFEQQGWSYHVIVLDSINRKVTVFSYSRDNYEAAVNKLEEFERTAVEGEKIEPVLVSAGKLAMLRKAYPNFFLDIRDFSEAVTEIIDSVN